MQGNRSRDTKPELAVRRILHARGLRYLLNRRPVPELRRTADLVFSRVKVAVFIDGCFWHGCPVHYSPPIANASYWSAKVEGNKSRDADTTKRLIAAGWTVLRFWSHQDPTQVADAVQRTILRLRHSRGSGLGD